MQKKNFIYISEILFLEIQELSLTFLYFVVHLLLRLISEIVKIKTPKLKLFDLKKFKVEFWFNLKTFVPKFSKFTEFLEDSIDQTLYSTEYFTFKKYLRIILFITFFEILFKLISVIIIFLLTIFSISEKDCNYIIAVFFLEIQEFIVTLLYSIVNLLLRLALKVVKIKKPKLKLFNLKKFKEEFWFNLETFVLVFSKIIKSCIDSIDQTLYSIGYSIEYFLLYLDSIDQTQYPIEYSTFKEIISFAITHFIKLYEIFRVTYLLIVSIKKKAISFILTVFCIGCSISLSLFFIFTFLLIYLSLFYSFVILIDFLSKYKYFLILKSKLLKSKLLKQFFILVYKIYMFIMLN